MPSNKAQNNIITVRGRERSLTPKQKSLFSNLGNYGIDLLSLKKDNIHINKKLFFEIGFGSGDIIFKQAKNLSFIIKSDSKQQINDQFNVHIFCEE